MQYPGVEFQTLYTHNGKNYRTVGIVKDFNGKNSDMVVFSDVTGDVQAHYLPVEEFTDKFTKTYKYI